jgi:hypothetical protein
MTMPHERTRALVHTRAFLESLVEPSRTPRVPRSIRQQARALLRHFPGYAAIDMAHMTCPHLYGPVAPYLRDDDLGGP